MLFVLTVAGMLTVHDINDYKLCLAVSEELAKSSKVERAFCAYMDDGDPVIGKKKGDFDGEITD